jgi:adiponectin receptor
VFLFAGISTAFPMIHLLCINGNPGTIPNQNFSLFVFGGLAYIIGAIIYIMRVPEKHCPGTFCIWGSSHQIWHCLVITGIVLHYYASIDIYHERLRVSECPVI